MKVRLSPAAHRHLARRHMNIAVAMMPKTTVASLKNGSLKTRDFDDYEATENQSSLVNVPFQMNAPRLVGFGTTMAPRLRKQHRPVVSNYLVMTAIEGNQ